jgi:hypothetical protein
MIFGKPPLICLCLRPRTLILIHGFTLVFTLFLYLSHVVCSTSTVKVILKPILFPLNLYQTFFLPVIFSVHLKVSFVHLFTGVVYYFQGHLNAVFFLPVHYIYHTIFFMTNIYGHLNAFFFLPVFCPQI